jgi:hypothetical protein
MNPFQQNGLLDINEAFDRDRLLTQNPQLLELRGAAEDHRGRGYL